MTNTPAPTHMIVWAEIPVSNLDKAMDYYSAVLDVEFDVVDMGPNKTAVFKTKDMAIGVSGHLYEGKPATSGDGPTVHMTVPGKLEDAMARATKAGGDVISEPVTIPPGRFAYTKDPDGNSIGLFEVN